jgi:urease accessory protein
MLIQNKIGRLDTFDTRGKKVDVIYIEWFEARKRILRKTTQAGKEVSIKFLEENPDLTEGDVCECIVVKPKNMFEMASVCYEIGNKHLPLFYEADQLLVPFEMPLYRTLYAQGYTVVEEKRKLKQPLQTSVLPHSISISGNLFSKEMKLTGTQSKG